MQRRGTSNIAHVAVTDHFIHRPNENESDSDTADAVVAWRDPPPEFRQRDLALADLEIGSEKHLPATIQEGVKLLQTLPAAQQNSDADVLSNLEAVYLQTSSPEKAVALSRWAAEVVPKSGTFAMNLGIALKRAGQPQEAERQLRRAIELDPSLMQAYAELAVLYDSEGRADDASKTISRFLEWNPQSIQFQLARAQ
jgi:Flp pilus assembly protein TadD